MKPSLTELIEFYHNLERELPLKMDIIKFRPFCYKQSEDRNLEC